MLLPLLYKFVGLAQLAIMPTAAIGGPAQPVKSENPPSVKLIPRGWTGTGCNESNTQAAIVGESTVSITYSAFSASAPGVIKDRTKSCETVFRLEYPKGYTFSIVSAHYWTGVRVENGGRAELESVYSFADSDEKAHAQKVWDKPVSKLDDFVHKLDRPMYLPCGGAKDMFISTVLSAYAGPKGEGAIVGVTAMDTSVRTDLHIDWETCK